MKRFKNSAILLIISCLTASLCFSQTLEKRCASADYYKQKGEDFKKKRQTFEQSVKAIITKNKPLSGKKSAITELLRIPVVVHVIHNNAALTIGGKSNANISDEQIKSQIEVLNEDYRRKANTLGFNTNPVGTDMNIEFYLAETDPDGNTTNGITRKFSDKQTFDPFSDADQALLSKLSYWPSDCYLNIWTTALANNYLGFSAFPYAPNISGLEYEGDKKVDGVFIDYRYFGRNTDVITSKYYKFGRTTTHEVGHWLGLIHTWGDEDCGDDYVGDTPVAQNANLTVFCNDKFSNCKGTRTRNMIENYMDYTIDSCMNVFTIGQMQRVDSVFKDSDSRKKLVECSARLPESEIIDLQITPNPAIGSINGNLLFKGESDAEIIIFDQKGNEIDRQVFIKKKSFKFSYPIYNLSPGIYIIYARVQGQQTTKKIYFSH
jgi:Pregnancy-associated plasma protein-A